MSIRSRAEKSIIESLNQNIPLEDISLNLSAPRAETDMLLMKLLNRYHLKIVPMPSTSCPIHRLTAAA